MRALRITAMLLGLAALAAGLTGLALGVRILVAQGGRCASDGGSLPAAGCTPGVAVHLLASAAAGGIGYAGYRLLSPGLAGPHLAPLALPLATLPSAAILLSHGAGAGGGLLANGLGLGLLLLAIGGWPLVDLARHGAWRSLLPGPAAPRAARVPGYPRGYTAADALRTIDEGVEAGDYPDSVAEELRAKVRQSPLGQAAPPAPAADPRQGLRFLTLAQAIAVVAGVVAGALLLG